MAEAGKQVGARLRSVSRDKGDFGKLSLGCAMIRTL